jgi:hypothetical protein
MKRAYHLVAAILLLVMAIIQLNDPDPIYWVTVYTAAALIPAGQLIGRKFSTLWVLVMGMIIAGLLISLPGFWDYLTADDYLSITREMLGDKPYVEYGREFLGLLIAVFLLLPYRYRINFS